MEGVAAHLPAITVLALLCYAVRLFQRQVEEDHRRERELPEYEYFDILRWP